MSVDPPVGAGENAPDARIAWQEERPALDARIDWPEGQIGSETQMAWPQQQTDVDPQTAWPLDRPLPADPRQFNFFQAVRTLETRFRDAPVLGGRGPASRERIRLRPSLSLGFPTSDVADARWLPAGPDHPRRVEITTNFFGLTGVTTPLPLSYAQEVLREDDEAPQLRAFLDMFHHRLLSLLYRTWVRQRHAVAFEPGGRDRLSLALLDLIGESPGVSPAKKGMAPERLIRYLSLLLMPSRPAGGLESLLAEELDLPVRVEQLAPRWVELNREQRFKLNRERRGRGMLGRDITIGSRLLDRSGQIRIVLGPAPYDRLESFRPARPGSRRLIALVRLYVRQPLMIALRLLIPAADFPKLRLGREARGALGRTGYMGPSKEDPMVLDFELSPEGS